MSSAARSCQPVELPRIRFNDVVRLDQSEHSFCFERGIRKQRFDLLLSKAMNSVATGVEIAELAKEIHESSQKVAEVNTLPPNSLFKWWKHREDNKTYTYALVPGQVEGKHYIYSNLISVYSPPPKL